jgi:L-fuconolactonase
MFRNCLSLKKRDAYGDGHLRIDAHQHFWKLERCEYHWLTPEAGILYRDYVPEDLRPLLRKNNIDKSIVVESAQTATETDYLLELAKKTDFIAGVVGWLNLDTENFEDEFGSYAANRHIVGIRPIHQGRDTFYHPYNDDRIDDKWLVRPRVIESLRIIANKDFPVDLNVMPRHLPDVLTIMKEIPNLRCVIDHIGKPNIASKEVEPWSELMSELATYRKAYCKLSGMITEAGGNWKPTAIAPYVSQIIDVFGLDRVMYGSDWPVCLKAGSYDEQIEALQRVLADRLDENSETLVFGGNAARFFKL